MGETLELTAEDGHRLAAYLARPEGPATAGLVVCQEVFGVNEHIRRVTDGYAAAGYLAIAPALFDRAERGVELGYSGDDLTEGRRLRGEIPWDRAVADIEAAELLEREGKELLVARRCPTRRAAVSVAIGEHVGARLAHGAHGELILRAAHPQEGEYLYDTPYALRV